MDCFFDWNRSSSVNKFNSLSRENHLRVYSSDMVASLMSSAIGSRNNNADSVSFSSTSYDQTNNRLNYHKSCDTIDQNSGYNYYLLHSMISYAAEKKAFQRHSKSYSLHANDDSQTTIDSKSVSSAFLRDNFFLKKIQSFSPKSSAFLIRFKYNQLNCSSISKSIIDDQHFFFAVKFFKDKRKNFKFLLAKNLPSIQNYCQIDDTVDDPLQEFIRNLHELRDYLYTCFRCQTKKLLYIKDESDLPTCILLRNLLECFQNDFRQYNYKFNLDDYYDRFRDRAQQKLDQFRPTDLILLSYLRTMQLF